MGQGKKSSIHFFLTRKILMRTLMRRGLRKTENRSKNIYILWTDISDVGELYGSILLCWVLFRVYAWCGAAGQLHSSGWLCKTRTMEDHVLHHATVVSSTKSRGISVSAPTVVLYWRVCSLYITSMF